MLRIATVTLKADGTRYAVYQVPGDHGEDYTVWVSLATGWPCKCPCRSRQFRGDKLCKHMLRLKRWLDEQRQTSPLYHKEWSMMS